MVHGECHGLRVTQPAVRNSGITVSVFYRVQILVVVARWSQAPLPQVAHYHEAGILIRTLSVWWGLKIQFQWRWKINVAIIHVSVNSSGYNGLKCYPGLKCVICKFEIFYQEKWKGGDKVAFNKIIEGEAKVDILTSNNQVIYKVPRIYF